MTSREIRQQFLDFFKSKDHAIVPSASVVPTDDPTLMFTNAGMNQFKDVFLGTGTRSYTRAADTQKCIRVSGKHNDLEEVGRSLYHHTFFEMLGNWSFGDYFKREAIAWAWELLTEVWGLPKERLHATVFGGDAAEGLGADQEAEQFWKEVTDINPAHISRHGKKDNFWEMGAVGPCGPCSEIHIDLTPDASGASLVNTGDPGVIELWNLVFIQFNRDADGKLNELPAKHVDTGMGFERLCMLLQNKNSNYDTDVFPPLFSHLEQITGVKYGGLLDNNVDVAFRVIADHLRCLTFALTDGAVPSNEGRGYVLRRILRRAVRYGRQYMDMHEPFLCDLVQPLVDQMADAFPELRTAHNGDNVRHVVEILRDEQESFLKTLERGIKIFDDEAGWVRTWSRTEKDIIAYEHGLESGDSVETGPPMISGGVAFVLHDTYGFPIDLTVLMAKERGLTVDTEEFERLMEEAREKSRAGTIRAVTSHVGGMLWRQYAADTAFIGYDALECEAHVVRSVAKEPVESFGGTISVGRRGILVLDKTPFYAEKGGQAGDVGRIISPSGQFKVEDTQEIEGVVAHIGRCVEGEINQFDELALKEPLPGVSDSDTFDGVPLSELPPEFERLAQENREVQEYHRRVERGRREPVQAIVDPGNRRPTMQNHTSTHILNWALREVLGEGVQQKGSLVDADKTRFDFSHNKPVTVEELERVEALANQQIAAKHPVFTQEVDQAKALRIKTLRAVFGEQYPERVRVVSIGAPIGDEENPALDTLLGSPDDPKWMKYPVEFCGGTHLANSGEAERFVLISEEGVAKGVRRVVGLSGEAARKAEATGAELLQKTDALLTAASRDHTFPSRDREGADLSAEVASLQRTINEAVIPAVVRHKLGDKLAELRRMAKKQAKQRSAESGRSAMEQVAALLESAETVNGVAIVVGQIDDAPAEALRGAIDWVRNKTQASAMLLASVSGVKVTLVAGMSTDVVDSGVKAGDLVREIAPIVGGSGGGKPTLAQAGGKDPDAVPEALERAKKLLRERLGGLGR